MKLAIGHQRRFYSSWVEARKLIADGPTIEELEADEPVLTEWIHTAVLGHYHASCSNRMGAPDDPGAVCDPAARRR